MSRRVASSSASAGRAVACTVYPYLFRIRTTKFRTPSSSSRRSTVADPWAGVALRDETTSGGGDSSVAGTYTLNVVPCPTSL